MLIGTFYLKDNFYFENQELDLWEVQGTSFSDDTGFMNYLSNAPLAYHNFLGPFLKLKGEMTFLFPHFSSLPSSLLFSI